MTLRELQTTLRARLLGDEPLFRARAAVFCEDALPSGNEPLTALQSGAGGLAIVIGTPEARPDAARSARGGLSLAVTVRITCLENPAVNRAQDFHRSALWAVERVAHLLDDGQTLTFDRFTTDLVGTRDETLYSASAEFSAHITHTLDEE